VKEFPGEVIREGKPLTETTEYYVRDLNRNIGPFFQTLESRLLDRDLMNEVLVPG